MQRTLLKAKLHRVTTTASELEYEGSCEIDGVLLDAAGISAFEQIQIYNIANGNRFTTYAIRGKENSGVISVNGAAAHKAAVGDLLIIAAYAIYDEQEVKNFTPNLCYVDDNNVLTRQSSAIS
ncbi:aspartate 1-decarboxylase [Candidatus Thioglobus sp.]|jgi:aspartate 1-decarboxylase|uniref:aspartate 1-decarboxylase n=1 Tax=Candidatus Thioglobus sp. TaxID=2026721 RepID=UPI001E0C0E0C|nr:aspartate 1-decarboxylase [Candidatus Thioglobus sp.]MBT3277018.1 aspartate 1-decarboxylase [Candidatus Thioglobus sp.]MBT3446698.1 aspartate 1-decarboxylase [Candidatus Thioglobus sp.]MBT3744557.1 aspartate 1-decarboxylase [Candidatus Thioglobus sp.]MBT4001452.1 aspartate 1-decarboxylase [Candidatus Thioglobus sp.]MBT4181515.1 aspartate 1-decarboxylase [Candidatus Thioglobus sp.]